MAPKARNTIFVHSILPRSGTFFVTELLKLHPHCRSPSAPFYEDFFLKYSDHLTRYACDLRDMYRMSGFPDAESVPSRVLDSFGESLLGLLHEGCPTGCRVVTKTPSIEGLANCESLFKGGRVVIVIRDGRSVVHSYCRTFDTGIREAAMRWDTAVKQFIDLRNRLSCPFETVYYEHLVTNPTPEMERLLAFLDLDPSQYPFHRAGQVPVHGSSEFGRGQGAVHWNGVPRTSDFNPLYRYRSWSQEEHAVFNDIAGESQHALGYGTGGGD